MKSKPISQIWWIAVDPCGCPLWPYLQLRKCDAVECLTIDTPDWKSQGWRIAKLQVTEMPLRKKLS